MDPALAEIGATANNYQVLAKLATGGMAEIFLARSVGVGAVQRYVVLKRVLREHARDITFVRMFLEEARLVAQLQHPNIAQVYDAGKLGDSYFFTMEYVHGETVRSVLQRAHELRRSPPINCVLATMAGTAAGLHHAHERIGIEGRPLGIVHRDVSPSNLMIGYDGSVKVVDFGVAKSTGGIDTQAGAVKGKIAYLSPEQARGQRVDRRSDVFSLGIVMWEMLTVERLYTRENDFGTMYAIIHDAPPPPSMYRRDIPPELDALVMRALAKDPDARFQTAEHVAEAIEAVATQIGATLAPSSLSRLLRDLFGTKPEPWVELRASPSRPDAVTITSEPIPEQLAIALSDPIDRRLAAVTDLSSVPRPGPFTRHLVAAEPQTVTPTPITADSPTAPRRFDATAPAAPVRSMITPTQPPARGFPFAYLAAAIAILVAGIIAVVIGTSHEDVAPEAAAIVPASEPDAAPIVDAIAIAIDASAPDAMAIVEPVVVEPPPEPPPEPAPRQPPPSKKPPKRPERTPKTDLAKLFAARAYNRVVQECIDVPRNDRAICTHAACQIKDASHAKRWFAKVDPAKQAAVENACKALGVRVAPCRDAFECID